MSITDARLELAQNLASGLSPIPVFASPPTQVVTPSVVIHNAGSVAHGPSIVTQEFQVEVIGPAGDNEAAVRALEAMLFTLALSLPPIYKQPVIWDRPKTLSNVGQVYLTCTFSILVDISLLT